MQNWRVILLVSVMLFLSLGFAAWRESVFNDRMNEDIREMAARLQQSNMPADQIAAVSSALLLVKHHVSSLASALGNVIIWTYLAIFIAVSAVERLLGKPKHTEVDGT